jgi:FMN phosphatase YigB (HAD superfamily)
VIHKTFKPLLNNGQSLPEELAPRLLHRFSSSEGYVTEPNLVPAIKALKQKTAKRRFENIVVGVITNSDDRVPDVLSSFGLDVSQLRYGSHTSSIEGLQNFDIDFHCMSYDVGVEKPDKFIFEAARHMLAQILTAQCGNATTETASDIDGWVRIYVGDEYEKDIVGSMKAGWNPVLLAEGETSLDIPKLEDIAAQSITELFGRHTMIRTKSIEYLAAWLAGKT